MAGEIINHLSDAARSNEFPDGPLIGTQLGHGGHPYGRCARPGTGVESGAVADQKGKAAVLTELSLILAAVFWGTNYAATKYAAEYLP